MFENLSRLLAACELTSFESYPLAENYPDPTETQLPAPKTPHLLAETWVKAEHWGAFPRNDFQSRTRRNQSILIYLAVRSHHGSDIISGKIGWLDPPHSNLFLSAACLVQRNEAMCFKISHLPSTLPKSWPGHFVSGTGPWSLWKNISLSAKLSAATFRLRSEAAAGSPGLLGPGWDSDKICPEKTLLNKMPCYPKQSKRGSSSKNHQKTSLGLSSSAVSTGLTLSCLGKKAAWACNKASRCPTTSHQEPIWADPNPPNDSSGKRTSAQDPTK